MPVFPSPASPRPVNTCHVAVPMFLSKRMYCFLSSSAPIFRPLLACATADKAQCVCEAQAIVTLYNERDGQGRKNELLVPKPTASRKPKCSGLPGCCLYLAVTAPALQGEDLSTQTAGPKQSYPCQTAPPGRSDPVTWHGQGSGDKF